MSELVQHIKEAAKPEEICKDTLGFTTYSLDIIKDNIRIAVFCQYSDGEYTKGYVTMLKKNPYTDEEKPYDRIYLSNGEIVELCNFFDELYEQKLKNIRSKIVEELKDIG